MKIYYLCTLKYTDMKKNLLNIQKLLGEKELEELRTYSLTVWHPSPTNGYTEYDNIAINNNSYIYLLVEQGEAQVMINYKFYRYISYSCSPVSHRRRELLHDCLIGPEVHTGSNSLHGESFQAIEPQSETVYQSCPASE